jgi:protein-tyrosine phosphatase
LATLARLGIRTVCDFRSAAERTRDVTPDLTPLGIATVVAPVFESDASPVGQATDAFPGFAHVYRRMLETGGAAFAALANTIAHARGGVLFHCAAGKDRTGLAAALLLDVAGVHRDDIIADYAMSGSRLSGMLAAWLPRMAERGIPIEKANALMDAHPCDMAVTLDFIHSTWGSAEGYFLDNGLAPTALGMLQRRLVA